jgi:hypothetical protein
MCSLDSKVDYFLDSHLQVTNGIQRSPKGLTFVPEWGALRRAVGAAAMLAKLSRLLRADPDKAQKANEALALAEQQVRRLPQVCSRAPSRRRPGRIHGHQVQQWQSAMHHSHPGTVHPVW